MVILGYACALLIGILIGALGSGGSLLAVPTFLYLFGLNAIESTTYSLFVVGVAASFAVYKHQRDGNIAFRASLPFAISALLTTYITRRFLLPAMPDLLYEGTSFTLTKDTLIVLTFSMVMILSSLSVLRGVKEQKSVGQYQNLRLTWMGLLVGLLSGFVGAGGGFLIVPALIVGLRLPIKKAIATSVWLVLLNSSFGFLGSVASVDVDWVFLGGFSLVSIVGLLLGLYVQKYIADQKLKKIFAVFVLTMGVIILFNQG